MLRQGWRVMVMVQSFKQNTVNIGIEPKSLRWEVDSRLAIILSCFSFFSKISLLCLVCTGRVGLLTSYWLILEVPHWGPWAITSMLPSVAWITRASLVLWSLVGAFWESKLACTNVCITWATTWPLSYWSVIEGTPNVSTNLLTFAISPRDGLFSFSLLSALLRVFCLFIAL